MKMHRFIVFLTLIAAYGSTDAQKCRVIRNTMLSCLEAKEEDLPKAVDQKVTWLTLTKSSFPKIKKSFMLNFPKLTDFHAENANIESIEANAFTQLVGINWIDVSLNKIKEISPDLLSNSRLIDHFNISGNGELSIPRNKPILTAASLKWLDISSCNVRELYSESFSKLTSLRDLSLANNLLKTLPEDIFKNNRGLLSLDITNNKIKTLSAKIFLNMRTMVVRFEDNPWNCDCQLSPLIQWSRRNVVKGDVKCDKPNNKRWKELTSMQPCA